MIRIVLSNPASFEGDAVIRSVGTDLEACTPTCAHVGIQAGEELLDRLRRSGEVPVGGAVVTPAGLLRSKFLIHIVIRSEEEPISEESISRAFRNGLRQAEQWQLETLATPPLGTGAGNLDAEDSARVMCAVLREHTRRYTYPRDVVIAVANAYEQEAFTREIARPETEVPEVASASDREVDEVGSQIDADDAQSLEIWEAE